LVALCALALVPKAIRDCRRAQRSGEAAHVLAHLVQQVNAASARDGKPATPVGPTPPLGACCQTGGVCAANPAAWSNPAWQRLAFTIDSDHRFSYEIAAGENGQLLLAAHGDLNCDGVTQVVRWTLSPSDSGYRVSARAHERPGE
jgi:hypothetical protein